MININEMNTNGDSSLLKTVNQNHLMCFELLLEVGVAKFPQIVFV